MWKIFKIHKLSSTNWIKNPEYNPPQYKYAPSLAEVSGFVITRQWVLLSSKSGSCRLKHFITSNCSKCNSTPFLNNVLVGEDKLKSRYYTLTNDVELLQTQLVTTGNNSSSFLVKLISYNHILQNWTYSCFITTLKNC